MFQSIFFSLHDSEKRNDEKSIRYNPFAKQGPFRFYRVGSILKVNLILSPLANKTQVGIIILANFQGDAEHILFVIILFSLAR